MKRNFFKLLLALGLVGTLLAGCATSSPPGPEVKQALAPSGELRVGVYQGSPTSIIGDPASPQAKGVAFELGRHMAAQLGVGFRPVVFAKNADLLKAAEEGKVDFVFTNATPARAKFLDFSPHVLYIEKGYLVAENSRVKSFSDVDRAGIKVGASQGSTTVKELETVLKQAQTVQVVTLQSAAEMLADGRLDAFATNKAILFELSDKLPGSKVLDGKWGEEQFAIGVPKGRDQGAAFVRQFVADMKAGGQIAQAIARVGLRGATVADAR